MATTKTQYIGVYKLGARNKFAAYVKHDRRQYYAGSWDILEAAAKAYDEKADEVGKPGPRNFGPTRIAAALTAREKDSIPVVNVTKQVFEFAAEAEKSDVKFDFHFERTPDSTLRHIEDIIYGITVERVTLSDVFAVIGEYVKGLFA